MSGQVLTPEQAIAEQGPAAFARVMQGGGEPFRRLFEFMGRMPAGTFLAICAALVRACKENEVSQDFGFQNGMNTMEIMLECKAHCTQKDVEIALDWQDAQ